MPPTLDRTEQKASPLPSRSCDGCTLCCLVIGVPSLDKPRLQNCAHCRTNEGCGIYNRRPEECQDFFCLYRLSAMLGEEWRPRDSHMVATYEKDARRFNFICDPGFPLAWREEPYLGQIRDVARAALLAGGHVIVWEGSIAVGILPNREVSLGQSSHNLVVVVLRRETSSGPEFDMKIEAAGA